MSNLAGILGELQVEGVLRLYHDYRSGSLKDWSGNGNDGTILVGGSAWTHKGLKMLAVNSGVQVADDSSIAIASCTLVARRSIHSFSATAASPLMSKRNVASSTIQFDWVDNSSATQHAITTSAATHTLTTPNSNGERTDAVSITSGVSATQYINGVLVGSYATAPTIVAKNEALHIGNYPLAAVAANHQRETWQYALIISRPLTATEHQTLYQQLQQMSWPTKPYSRNMKPRYTEANNSGMQFRYSGAKRDRKYLDSSGNGNTSTGAVSTSTGKTGIGMSAGTSVVTSPVTTTTVPVSASHSMSAFIADSSIVTGATYGGIAGPNAGATQYRYGGIHCDATNLSLTWYNGSSYRTASKAYNSKLKHHVAYVIDYTGDIGRLYVNGNYVAGNSTVDISAPASPVSYLLGAVGYSSPTIQSIQGQVGDGTLWNRALTSADIRSEWLQYAQMVQWKSGWGVPESLANESTANTFLGQNNSPYEIISGTWKITTKLVDGRWCKCIDNIAAGTIWLPLRTLAINDAEAAYGSWAGRVYHASSATPTILALTNSAKAIPGSSTGHVIRVYNAESRLSRNASGTYTDLATVAHTSGAIVDLHSTRRFDNVWQLYTKALGESWVTASSATDTNYTTSIGMSFTANAGDYLVLSDTAENSAWTKYLGEFDPREV